MSKPARGFHAVVLAGDRTAADPVARYAGVGCKAAARASGMPLLTRVLGALRDAPSVGRTIVVGPARACMDAHPYLASAMAESTATRIDPERSPSRSAAAGLRALGGELPALITTADHALLTASLVGKFMTASLAADVDLTVGLVPHARVAARFPGVRRTVLRFGPGYCTCNLFAVLTAAGSRVLEAWVTVEQERKHPARLVAGILGGGGLARYLVGVLTLEEALSRASQRLGARIAPVILDDPEASVDVDTPDDLRRVEEILARRAGSPAPP